QPGAPNEYKIETKNLRHLHTPAKVSVRVLGDGKPVFEVAGVNSQGSFDLKLPADIDLKGKTDLALEVTAEGQGGPRSELTDRLPLARPVYVTHLTTDKYLYRPGETVFFRSLTLDRSTFRPAQDDLHIAFRILAPDGNTVVWTAAGSARVAVL